MRRGTTTVKGPKSSPLGPCLQFAENPGRVGHDVSVMRENLGKCLSGGGYTSCSHARKLGLSDFRYCKKK